MAGRYRIVPYGAAVGGARVLRPLRRLRRAFPLAVPDFVYARYHSHEIDRGANPYSLHLPQAALVGVAPIGRGKKEYI